MHGCHNIIRIAIYHGLNVYDAQQVVVDVVVKSVALVELMEIVIVEWYLHTPPWPLADLVSRRHRS